MDRQSIIGFVLIGLVLMVWMYLNAPEPVPPEEQQSGMRDTTLVQDAPEPVETTEAAEEDSVDPAELLKSAKASSAEETAIEEGEHPKRLITIENDVYKTVLSTDGARLRRFYTKEFNSWYADELGENAPEYLKEVQLINYKHGGSIGLEFITLAGQIINTTSLSFSTDAAKDHYVLDEGDSVRIEFTYAIDEESALKITYEFHGSRYDFDYGAEFINMHEIVSNSAYDVTWNGGLRFVEKNSVDEANYSNASAFHGDEQVIVNASDEELVKEDFSGRVDWVTVRNKYFASIISPDNPGDIEGAYIEGVAVPIENEGINEIYDLRIKMPFPNLNQVYNEFTVYIGPVDYDRLSAYNRNFDKIVDFGGFFGLKIIVRPIAEFVLMPLFSFIHKFIPNYGFVILVFSFIIKLVLYPLTKKSYQSMKKMQLLQPKITELKEKYKEDPQKMNKETMKLYSTYGVNPAGGCLPLLLQMPIFVALWGMFQTAIELRQQPFIFWIEDLSRPDVIYTLPFKLPLFGIQEIAGLAILMGVTTFFQQKMTIKDPSQKALVYVMPVMLTVLFMTFPSGLNLYYFLFNVLTIGQQWIINKSKTDVKLEPVKNPKKSKGFMQKMMEAAEKQAKTQQKKKR